MKKILIGVWHPSVILTYAGLAFTVWGIVTALSGNFAQAFLFLILAGVCDMFDGGVARLFDRTETEKEFGIQIDSLVDVCSFVLFPVCLLFCICGDYKAACIPALIYAIAGVARLAWFNIITHESQDFFFGLPVTSSSMLLPMVFLINTLSGMSENIQRLVWCGSYILLAILFVLNFKTKKPGIVFRLVMFLVAIGLIAALIFAV